MKDASELRPIDDLLFHLIYQDRAACQELLRVLYNDDELVVVEVTMQEDIANLIGRGARLDGDTSISHAAHTRDLSRE